MTLVSCEKKKLNNSTVFINNSFYLTDYSNIYQNNQPKSTPSSTYRPSTTQTPHTYAPKPQTQSTTYLTQTQAPKQKYNNNQQQDIYSSSDYDEALVAQVCD